ncbi:unnamed protein product [Trifolium pratense]|uniref:Uncharacterized protein n=1 Tax=Trifolium pratense TaxID=57577 RepID=A0ACB0JC33_TRIPR|nr:unnamed protein product [Trifolium pratense]
MRESFWSPIVWIKLAKSCFCLDCIALEGKFVTNVFMLVSVSCDFIVPMYHLTNCFDEKIIMKNVKGKRRVDLAS